MVAMIRIIVPCWSSSRAREALAAIAPQDIITLVSGLPRSGTSLMMQLLEAGLPAFTDGRRQAGASDEKGYYEQRPRRQPAHQPGQKLARRRPGHSLKVVAPPLSRYR